MHGVISVYEHKHFGGYGSRVQKHYLTRHLILFFLHLCITFLLSPCTLRNVTGLTALTFPLVGLHFVCPWHVFDTMLLFRFSACLFLRFVSCRMVGRRVAVFTTAIFQYNCLWINEWIKWVMTILSLSLSYASWRRRGKTSNCRYLPTYL